VPYGKQNCNCYALMALNSYKSMGKNKISMLWNHKGYHTLTALDPRRYGALIQYQFNFQLI